MIERYTNPEMGHLWSIENEWQQILNVEMAACDAMAELGEIPAEAAKNIRAKAKFDVKRIHEIEETTQILEGQSREWRKLVKDLEVWEMDEVVTDYVSNLALQLLEELSRLQVVSIAWRKLSELMSFFRVLQSRQEQHIIFFHY